MRITGFIYFISVIKSAVNSNKFFCFQKMTRKMIRKGCIFLKVRVNKDGISGRHCGRQYASRKQGNALAN